MLAHWSVPYAKYSMRINTRRWCLTDYLINELIVISILCIPDFKFLQLIDYCVLLLSFHTVEKLLNNLYNLCFFNITENLVQVLLDLLLFISSSFLFCFIWISLLQWFFFSDYFLNFRILFTSRWKQWKREFGESLEFWKCEICGAHAG